MATRIDICGEDAKNGVLMMRALLRPCAELCSGPWERSEVNSPKKALERELDRARPTVVPPDSC